MPFTLAATGPLRGLSFANPAPLALHLRDDHRRRPRPTPPTPPPPTWRRPRPTDQPERTTRCL
jgi:hypothetical protein